MPALDLARRWTREEVLALPDDGNKYELVDGELLVSPPPRPVHERTVVELTVRLLPHVRSHGLGELYSSRSALDLEADHVVQPDLFVSAHRGITKWSEVGVPLLVIEILSPRTAKSDRVTKRKWYQRSGVPTYWIFDLGARAVEVWSPDSERPQVVRETLAWRPSPAVPALELDLPALFSTVLDPKTTGT